MSIKYNRRNSKGSDDDIERALSGIFFLFVGYFGYVYYTDSLKFWYQIKYYVLPGIGLLCVLIVAYVCFLVKRKKIESDRSDSLIAKIKEAGFDVTVRNFIVFMLRPGLS